MKRTLKVIGAVFIALGVLVAITLLAWVSWQVMPANPHRDEWTWNLPPFPLAIAVWFVGIPFLIVLAFVTILIVALGSELVKKFRKKVSS